jgi:hypothetical protein
MQVEDDDANLARKEGESGVGDVRACMHVLDQTGRIEIVACGRNVQTGNEHSDADEIAKCGWLFLGSTGIPGRWENILKFAPFRRGMCGGISRRAECVREAMLQMQPPSLCNGIEHE